MGTPVSRFLAVLLLGAACKSQPSGKPNLDSAAQAQALAEKLIIVDGHIDVPYRLREKVTDISRRTEDGDFDYVRAQLGGLNAPFMSIFVPAKYQQEGGAKKVADDLIDMVEGFGKKWPDKFVVVRSPQEVRSAVAAGKIALPMGIENGGALEDDISNVQHFYDRGVRYVTLTHAKDNLICDSSYDKSRTHGGLSAFGKKVVREMNRVGIMVDVSHLSDEAIEQVLDVTEAPVIASHSSLRHFVPGFQRNLPDALVKRIAANGGVVMVNFGSAFVTAAANDYFFKRWKAIRGFAEENGVPRDHQSVKTFGKSYDEKHPPVYATLSDVADHIERVVELVGIDHVGLGSDYDGVGDSLPRGLEDVSKYPALIQELLKRGFSEADIEKVCSANVFRVWDAVISHGTRPKPKAASQP